MKQKNKLIKIAIYIRVSTHHQIDKESLPFQQQELENYCKYILNTENYVIFIDAGYSAKNTDRPKFQEMMTRTRQGEFTHLLVWKIDRISRNLRDFTEMWDELADYGVQFISKMEQFDTSTAMGQAMLQIILVFAELERKLTAERVFSLMVDRASKGLWNGAPVAIGYEWDYKNEKVVINEAEAQVVRLIFDMYEKTGSCNQVANYLAENNILTKRGGAWGSKGVWDVLRNPAYIGIYRWNYRSAARGKKKPDDEVITIKDALPTIITEEQFERVQSNLDKNYRGRASQGKTYIPLSGLIRCADCQKFYVGRKGGVKRKDHYQYILYQCGTYSRNGTCKNPNIPSLEIEPWLLDYIRAYAWADRSGQDILETFDHQEIEHIEIIGTGQVDLEAGSPLEQKPNQEQQRLAELTQQKNRIERALARLDDTYFFADGQGLTKNEYIVKRTEMRSKLDGIDKDIKKVHKTPINPVVDTEMLSRFLILNNLFTSESLSKTYPQLEPQALHEFFHSVIKEVKAKDKRVEQIIFYSTAGEIIHKFYYR